MNHIPDQELLLMAHHALGPFRSIAGLVHMRKCAQCRKRLSEYASLSSTVAGAVRVGMPAWKPLGLAIGTKLLLSIAVVGLAILFVENMAIRSANSSQIVPAGACANPVVKKAAVIKPNTAANCKTKPLSQAK